MGLGDGGVGRVLPADYELFVLGRELAEGQPVHIGEQHRDDDHHVPDVGVQVVHQLPVRGAADLFKSCLDIGEQGDKCLFPFAPLRPIDLRENCTRPVQEGGNFDLIWS